MTLRILLAGAGCALALLASPSSADQVQDGYFLSSLPYPGQALTATLSDGTILSFDGIQVVHNDEAGIPLQTLATFQPPVWGSFLRVDPGETFVLVGESSTGGIHRVDLAGAGATTVASLINNYDAVFEDADHVLVSAATCGFGCGNEVHRLDLATGATTLVATVGGPSGPVALGPAGELYYGTVVDSYPPPSAASEVLGWSASQLTGAPVVTEAQATVVGTGYETIGSLVLDPVDGFLYLAENDYATGANRIRRVAPSAAAAPILLDGTPYRWITNLEFLPGDGVARFRRYQPATGGRLLYDSTDFATLFARNEIAPLRPSVLLAGPGTTGAGNVDLAVVGGAPGGTAWAYYGPSALYDPNEITFFLVARGVNLFLGLDPGSAILYPVPAHLDDAGFGGFSFLHDGSLLGMVAIQALVLDAGGEVMALSHAAFL